MNNNNKREWTDDEVANLIELYEEDDYYGMLNIHCNRNREKKMSMFDEFATKFENCDGAEVQQKIHNLHNQVCTYTY